MDNNYNNDNSQNESSFNQQGTQQGNYQQQNYQPQGGYYQQQNPNADLAQSKATVSLILGICSIVTCCCMGIVGVILGVLALIFSKQSTELNGGIENSYAKAGRICGIVGIVLGAIYFIYWIASLIIGFTDLFDMASYSSYYL